MNQKILEGSIRSALIHFLQAQGVTLPVIAGNQPTGQGRTDGVYFFMMNDAKRGWQSRSYSEVVTQVPAILKATEKQINETMFQFGALVQDDINDDDQLLADDVLSIARSCLSSLPFVESLAKMGIGVQRPTDILNPVFVNEHDQYEFNPNFTIVFTHDRAIEQLVPYTETVVSDIHRV